MISATYPAPSAPPMPKFPFLAKGKATGGLYLITAYHSTYPNVWCGVCLIAPEDGSLKIGNYCEDFSPPNLEYVPEVILRSEY